MTLRPVGDIAANWMKLAIDLEARNLAQRMEIARLRETLERYATDLCEMGRHHDCCGRLSPVECGGCAARAELTRLEALEHG